MNTRTITVAADFATMVPQMFSLLQQLGTLQYVAAPYAAFRPEGQQKELILQAGETFRFHLWLFGLISMGTHTLCIVELSPEGLIT